MGVGGITVATALWRAKGHYAIPVKDPNLSYSLRYTQAMSASAQVHQGRDAAARRPRGQEPPLPKNCRRGRGGHCHFRPVHPLVDEPLCTPPKERCSRPARRRFRRASTSTRWASSTSGLFSLDQRAAQKRLQQMNRLNTYGWLDKQAGIVHIPVDVAMDMLVQEQKK